MLFSLISVGADGTALSIQNILDIRNFQNKELVMRIKSDVRNSDRVFYTDLNGFQVSFTIIELRDLTLTITSKISVIENLKTL